MKRAVARKPAPKKESAYEVAKRLGLIGCFSGPPDLALNHRKYFRRAMRARVSGASAG